MLKSKLAKLFTGYTDPANDETGRTGIGKRFYAKKVSGSVTIKTKRFLDSRPMKLFRKIIDLFSYASAKTYGALFLTFGLLSLIIGFSKNYFGLGAEVPLSSLIIGAVFAVLAVPLMLFDAPIAVILESFKPTEIIFFEFFCIKRLYYTGGEKAMSPVIGVFLGAVLAILGAFVPVWMIALGIAIILFVAISFLSPEFTFFSTLLTLPYISLIPYSSLVLALAATLGALSFGRKMLFGKRVVFLEQYDIVIWVMMLGILISGIFVKGLDSFVSALIIVSTFFGYFLASNTVTNRRLADCAINAVALSSIPAVIVSFVQYINIAASGEPLGFLADGICSTFNSSGSAAAFFLISTVFSLTLIRQTKDLSKGCSSALFLFNLSALIMTGEITAILALVLGSFAYASIRKGKWMIAVIPLLLILPYLILLIPEEWIVALPIRIYPEGTHGVIYSSMKAFANNIFLGIGMGRESFITEMQKYGVTGFLDSGNLFIELGLEAGIFAIGAFLLLLLIRLIHRYSYQKYITHSQVSRLSPFMSMSVFVLLVFGSFNYLFSDISVMYLFWCVFGIGSGALRVAKSEHDDRFMYFEDGKSSDSAVINLHLR